MARSKAHGFKGSSKIARKAALLEWLSSRSRAAVHSLDTQKAVGAAPAPAVAPTVSFALADLASDPGADGDADDYGSFVVVDGAAGDSDGVANGVIVTQWTVPTTNNGSASSTPDALDATLKLTAQEVTAGADGVYGSGDDRPVASTTFTDAAATVTVSTSVFVTHDETAGLQNASATPTPPAGDADDNDTSLTLPVDFNSRLTTLLGSTGPTETELGRALSGFNGTGTGAAVVTIAGAYTDLLFSQATGAPLNGQDSGLKTIDGTSIFLYTDSGSGSNNNIMLGRLGSSTGEIVLAAYLEEASTATGGSAKIWTVQYKALEHNLNGADPDDGVDLNQKLYVTALSKLEVPIQGSGRPYTRMPT